MTTRDFSKEYIEYKEQHSTIRPELNICKEFKGLLIIID